MVIVIGATGFIGMYTVERLIADGEKVIATGRNQKVAPILEQMGAQFISLDITKREDFDKLPTKGVKGVVLLAGLLPANVKVDITKDENAADYFEVNVIGTINVLEYCRKNYIRKVISNCSYSDVHGAWKKGIALKETEPRDFQFT